MSTADLEAQLEKIRRLSTSSLSNHQQVYFDFSLISYAGTLIAVEETLKEQNTELVPSSYVAVLVTLLEQQKDSGYTFVGPILYLLAVVLEYIPRAVAQAQFSTIMGILAGSLDLTNADPMLIRSVITCLESLLKAQDSRSWKQPITKKATQSIFILSLDQRPKVRRRAQEAAHNILLDIPRPMIEHPMANNAADFIIQSFEESNNDANYSLHMLNLISNVIDSIPIKRVEEICEKLLQILAINNPFIATETFKIFDKIFKKITADFDKKTLLTILNTLEEQKPNPNNTELSVTWLNIIKSGFAAYFLLDEINCESKVNYVFTLVFPYLELGKMQVKPTAIDCLNHVVSRCIRKGSLCSPDLAKELSAMLLDALSYRYRESWAGVFLIIASLANKLGESSRPAMDELLVFIENLRMDKTFELKKEADAALCASLESMGPKLFLDLFPLNIELHIPGLLKSEITKNKKTQQNGSNQEGRAWLLSLMKGHLKKANILYFIQNLLPLATKLDEQSFVLEKSGRNLQAKVASTLAIQIWALLGDFFYFPSDISESIDSEFIDSVLTQINQVQELRSTLINALDILIKNVLSRSKAVAIETTNDKNKQPELYYLPQTDIDKAIKDKAHLSQFTPTIMSTMFTLVSEIPGPRSRYIHDAITSFLTVTDINNITKAFQRILSMLNSALSSHTPPPAAENTNKFMETNPQPPAYSLLDLVGTFARFLDESTALTGIEIILPIINQTDDPNLQKKAYKLLRLFFTFKKPSDKTLDNIDVDNISDSDKLNKIYASRIVTDLLSATEFVFPLSRKNRLSVLAVVIKYMPSDQLHMIPSLLSEAIIGTKEVNEKSRISAFDLLIAMAEKMDLGGEIKTQKIQSVTSDVATENSNCDDTMLEDQTETKSATVEEYFNMVVAGFAAKTPYMISATVTSSAYLLNIFHDKLSTEFIKDMVDTVLMFVNSNSREIAKASLGFIKVVVLELPKTFIQSILKEIVEGILKWANEHRARFAIKSKHLIERLIRKFGIDTIDQVTPEEHKKLILNIRKSQIRAKRAKSTSVARNTTMGKDQGNTQKDYDRSESEYSDNSDSNSDDDVDKYKYRKNKQNGHGNNSNYGPGAYNEQGHKNKSGKPNNQPRTWIMEDTEKNEPLEFLSRSAFSQLSISKPSSKNKSRDKSSSNFIKTTKDNKLIFAEDSDDAHTVKTNSLKNKRSTDDIEKDEQQNPTEEDFYKQSLTNPDGFDRGNRNKIKFNKRKTGNQENEMDDDNDSQAFTHGSNNMDKNNAKKQKPNNKHFGTEYKSKKGKGDIKKKGKLEPYAYIPLDAKKLSGRSQSKVQIISKSKKDKRTGRK
ncbi:hypothetical protein BB561_003858 [Smittium simulii]|uniref:Uncharacterized protein n=1 Tax=Smittium simulii TaxID=133385 RepID=A0A2T9YJ83_9FUNG|nr:hypothetical protein BB561_003858 [Smittium simulii]